MRKSWTLETLQEEALKYKIREEFKKNSNSAYQFAQKRRILDQICQHMKILHKNWTNEQLQAEALKYEIRWDFQKNSGGAYKAAQKRKILDKICKHMSSRHWTIGELLEESSKYSNVGDFTLYSSKAYHFANKHKMLEQICQHMSRSKNISSLEHNLFNSIKQKYPNCKVLRDRKVKIINKPHIKGFDIDAFIPELCKGIEFDGKYWHSIPGLRRSRNDWPSEDLMNYHQIKDKYFLSKGIQLLHIKEEDWIKNQQNCIDKCFKFLSSNL